MSPKMKAPSFAWPVRIAAVHPVMAAVSDISFSVVYQHSSSLIDFYSSIITIRINENGVQNLFFDKLSNQ